LPAGPDRPRRRLDDRLEWLRSLLDRTGWAAVLVLAGSILLLEPPSEGGATLVAWLVAVVAGAFVVVLVATRAWASLSD
jgi:hypothetical protein